MYAIFIKRSRFKDLKYCERQRHLVSPMCLPGVLQVSPGYLQGVSEVSFAPRCLPGVSHVIPRWAPDVSRVSPRCLLDVSQVSPGSRVSPRWIFFRGEYFQELIKNIFHGWIFFKATSFQGWIFFWGEYFSEVNIFQVEIFFEGWIFFRVNKF